MDRIQSRQSHRSITPRVPGCTRALPILLMLAVFLGACASTPPVEEISGLTFCAHGNCRQLGAEQPAEQVFNGVAMMMLNSAGDAFTVCDADYDTRSCEDDDISMFIQGGPIPGMGTINGGKVIRVSIDADSRAIDYEVNNSMAFIGVPLITTDHHSRIQIQSLSDIRIVEDDHYTNWMAVGNQVMTFQMAVDYVNLDTGTIGGFYTWTSTGIGMGKGTGYALIGFPARMIAGDNWLDPSLLERRMAALQDTAEISTASPEDRESASTEAHGDEAPLAAAPKPEESRQLTALRRDLAAQKQALAQEREQADLEAEQIRLKLETLQAELKQQQLQAQKQEAARREAELELEKTRARLMARQREEAEAALKQARLKEEARQREAEATTRRQAYLASFGGYHALVIGNNAYQHLPRLETAENDARTVAEMLKQDYGYSVQTLINADRAALLTAVSQLRRRLTANDNLLIYYAGHGWLDRDADEGYWLPVDARMDNEVNWVSNTFVTKAIKAMRAKHVMVIADSCYSGKLVRGVKLQRRSPDYLSRMAAKRARVVLASGGLEPVADSGGDDRHSVFAAAFINALSENKDILDGTRLFQTIRRPVMVNSDQTPQYADIRNAGHDGGDFLFVRIR